MDQFLQTPTHHQGGIQDRAMREASLDSAYEDSTPRASPRPPPTVHHPAAYRQRRASFDTISSFTAASSATSVSMLAAQQNELMATVNRLAKSVDALGHNSVDARIAHLTERLDDLLVNSPMINTNARLSPYSRPNPAQNHQHPLPPAHFQRDINSRLNGTGRVGTFPAPPAFQHQQTPFQHQ